MAIRDAGAPIDEADLDLPAASPGDSRSSYHELLDAYRRRLVLQALEATDGNQAAAARRLGLTRQALSYLVRQLDIAPRG